MTTISFLVATTVFVQISPFPLEPNSRWTYLHEGREATVVEVMGSRRVRDVDTRIVRARGSWPLGSGRLLVTSDAHKIDVHGIDCGRLTLVNEPPLQYVRFPLDAGKQWESNTYHPSSRSGSGLAIRVIGLETVEVPAGRFDAWKVKYVNTQHLGTTRDFTAWFAPGTGFVKYEYWGRSSYNGGNLRKEQLEKPLVFELARFEKNAIIEDPPITAGHGPALPIDQLPDHVLAPPGEVTLYADFDDVRGEHVVLYLVNRQQETLILSSQDGDLYVKLEAQLDGAWERAQSHTYSWCGNSYTMPTFEPEHFFRFLGHHPSEGRAVAVRYRMYSNIAALREAGIATVDDGLTSNIGTGKVSTEVVESCRYDDMASQHSRNFEALSAMARGERITGSFKRAGSHRVNAIRSLERFPEARTEKLLRQLLADEHPGVRAAATSAIASIAPTIDTVALLESQLQDAEWQAHSTTIMALAKLARAQPRAAEVFEALLDCEDLEKRRVATRSLSVLPASTHMLTLVQKMLQDGHPRVQIAAVQALGDIAAESKEAVDVIEPLLTHAESHVRSSAAGAWSRAPLSKRTVAALRDMLSLEQEDQVIRRAIGRLGDFARRSEDARALLEELSLSDQDEKREQASRALERLDRWDASR